jgi:hypothetical protein
MEFRVRAAPEVAEFLIPQKQSRDAGCTHILTRVHDDARSALLSRRDSAEIARDFGGGESGIFCAGGRMTQISLKLFNKMPFVGSDIEEFFGARACAEIVAHVQVALGQVRCMYVRTSDQLAKAFPIALGTCPAASHFFFPDHDPVAGMRCQS